MLWMCRNYGSSFLVIGLVFSEILAMANTTPGIKFIENKNQWPAEVNFSARVPGGNMIFQSGKFQYYFLDEERMEELHHRSHNHNNESDGQSGPEIINGHAVEVNFIGSNKLAKPLPFGRSSEHYNYYIGNDPNHWASKAYAYEGFIYPSLYQDIDLKVYSIDQNIKYDFIVAPYADPSQIFLDYAGADKLILENGRLTVLTSLGEVIEQKPVAFQWIDGKKVPVSCEYFLEGNRLSFCFPSGYDPCYELTIDPLLIFSTYSGSVADNWGSTATPAENGNLYSAGVTSHVNAGGSFPATPGAFQTNYGGLYDIGILKYDSVGKKLLYATYLGGANSESPHSLVVNANNELIVLGTTSSANFPTTPNAFDRFFGGGASVTHVVQFANGSDIFVARIAKDGSKLLGSTFLGGDQNDGLNPSFGALTKNYGDELRGDIITDEASNIYISSVHSVEQLSRDEGKDSTYNGGDTDAILMKLSPDLTKIIWSTFLGGSGADASHTLKLDKDNGIFLAGGTTSPDFPIKSGGYQNVQKGDADGWI